MASNKKYWQSVEELKDSSIVETLSKNEFVEEIPTDEFLGDKKTLENSSTSRRDFSKVCWIYNCSCNPWQPVKGRLKNLSHML